MGDEAEWHRLRLALLPMLGFRGRSDIATDRILMVEHMTEFYSSGRGKERYIKKIFASAAPRYDFLNGIMSLGRHRAWRRFAVAQCRLRRGQRALDVAAGTGDLSLELSRAVGPEGSVWSVDFCIPMLRIAARKLSMVPRGQIGLVAADALKLPFPDGTFDCAAVGFALRNVIDVRAAVAEMTRVVRPGGKVVSIEIVGPQSGWLVPIWKLCFGRLMPAVARLFGGWEEAYRYLPTSVERFCGRQELKRIMEECGLRDIRIFDLALGTVSVHVGAKILNPTRGGGD